MMGLIFSKYFFYENLCRVCPVFHPMAIIYYIRSEEVEYNVHGFVNMHLVVEEPWWRGGGGGGRGMFHANRHLDVGCLKVYSAFGILP